MNDALLVAISMIPAAIAARMKYLSCVKGGQTKTQRFIKKSKAAGAVVDAIYVSSSYQYGDMTSDDAEMRDGRLIAKYAYVVDGEVYHKELLLHAYGLSTVDCPDLITVYYDPKNPKKCVAEQEGAKVYAVRSGCLSSIVIFTVISFTVFHLLRMFLSRGGL